MKLREKKKFERHASKILVSRAAVGLSMEAM
jgi:hypothetical protein